VVIIQPKLVGIDSSVFAGWAADAFSLEVCARDAARNALASLLTSDWIPLLSWHHFEELACHAEEQVVANRMALLRSLSHIAWIRTSADPTHLGSVVDLLAAEVEAVLAVAEGEAVFCREAVRASLVRYGTPDELETVRLWRELRPLLQDRQVRSREIASVAHTGNMQALERRVLDLAEMHALADPAASVLFRKQASTLARELSQRGDRRLQNPANVANLFTDGVIQAFRSMKDSGASPLAAFLREFDVPREDVTDTMSFDEFAELAARRKRLRIVCRSRNLDLNRIWPHLRYARITSLWVQEEIRRAQMATPKASGSDLADSYLAAFAPYLDAVVVDKRTHEYLSQSCRRSQAFESQLGRFLKVSSYKQLPQALQPEGRLTHKD